MMFLLTNLYCNFLIPADDISLAKVACVQFASKLGYEISEQGFRVSKGYLGGYSLDREDLHFYYSSRANTVISFSDYKLEKKAMTTNHSSAFFFETDAELWSRANSILNKLGFSTELYKPWRYQTYEYFGTKPTDAPNSHRGQVFVYYAVEPFGYPSLGGSAYATLTFDSSTGSLLSCGARVGIRHIAPNVKYSYDAAWNIAHNKYPYLKTDPRLTLRYITVSMFDESKTDYTSLDTARLVYEVTTEEGTTFVDAETGVLRPQPPLVATSGRIKKTTKKIITSKGIHYHKKSKNVPGYMTKKVSTVKRMKK